MRIVFGNFVPWPFQLFWMFRAGRVVFRMGMSFSQPWGMAIDKRTEFAGTCLARVNGLGQRMVVRFVWCGPICLGFGWISLV
jgi:hypothetical protein